MGTKKIIRRHFESLFGVKLSEKELYEEVTNSFNVWFNKQEFWFQLFLIDYMKEVEKELPNSPYWEKIELMKKKLKREVSQNRTKENKNG